MTLTVRTDHRVSEALARPRAILLDLDDTLYDHHYASRKAIEETISQDSALTAAGAERVEIEHRHWLELLHLDVARGARTAEDARNERWARILSHFGGDVFQSDLIANLQRENYLRHERAVPGSVEGVTALRDAGYTLCIVSNNTRAEQIGKLRRLGLIDAFADIVVSADHGINKPDARLFHIALDRLGIGGSHAVHVGDSWTTDVKGAMNAGIRPIWFNRFGATAPQANVVEVADLRELLHTLNASDETCASL